MSDLFRFYVYAYLREDGTPYYIGKGSGIRAWRRNPGELRCPKDRSRIILMEVGLSETGALALERRYIRWYGRKDLGTGILRNRTDGGDAPGWPKGRPKSPEHRAALAAASRGNTSRRGKSTTPETKAKLAAISKAWNRANPPSPEARAKMSAAAKTWHQNRASLD